MVGKKDIEKVLKNIPDPEIGVSVWDLGLIYDITIDKKTGNVEILMTLTSVGCPLFDEIKYTMEQEVKKIKGVKKATIVLTFEPPWTPDRMSKKAKTLWLGQ